MTEVDQHYGAALAQSYMSFSLARSLFLLEAVDVTWQGIPQAYLCCTPHRKSRERKYQVVVSAIGMVILGAFRSTLLGIIMAGGFGEARFAPRLTAAAAPVRSEGPRRSQAEILPQADGQCRERGGIGDCEGMEGQAYVYPPRPWGCRVGRATIPLGKSKEISDAGLYALVQALKNLESTGET